MAVDKGSAPSVCSPVAVLLQSKGDIAKIGKRGTGPRALVVGFPEKLALLKDCPRIPTLYLTRFELVTGALLEVIKPCVVVYPLFAPRFDAMAMTRRLGRLKYVGRVLVVFPLLPDPQMVSKELQNQAKRLRLHILTAKPR